MAEKGREINQTRGDVESGSIPPQERPDGEGMSQAVQCGRRHPGWRGERRISADQAMERLGHRARMDRPSGTEGEQRMVGLAPVGLVLKLAQVLGQLCSESRPEGNEPVLLELRLTDTEHAAVEVDILEFQPGDLSDT